MLTGGTLGLCCLEFPSFLLPPSLLTLRIPATELILHRVAYSVLALSLGLACPCDCQIRSIHNLQGFTRFVKESMSPAWHCVGTIPPLGLCPFQGTPCSCWEGPLFIWIAPTSLSTVSLVLCVPNCLISSPGVLSLPLML